MDIGADLLFLLFLVAICSGVIDAIAGGGGLISLPVLMMAGLSPAEAIATNKIHALSSVASSSHRYARAGLIKGAAIRGKIAASVVGAICGAIAIQTIDPTYLARVAPFILIGVALFFLLAPTVLTGKRDKWIGEAAFAVFVAVPIGFYDGFFGPGTGSLYAAAFVFFLGRNLRVATAETKILNMCGSLAAAFIFLPGGAIVWKPALVMAAGAIIGAQIGAHVALKWGVPLIRACLVIVSMLLAVKLLLE